jgi:thymidylate synthase (FAD)
MYAKIKAVTQAYDEDIKHMLPEDLIAYFARISNPSNQMNTETSARLLKYLVKHRHWSPFEMVNVVMEVETTRDIARQILRHRSFCFQEYSQRYADSTAELGFETREARLQDTNNRQNSIELDLWNREHEYVAATWEEMQTELIVKAETIYRWARSHGIAKEQARVVLPEGLMRSRLAINGTIRSWIHYCGERTKLETQKEHRLLAQACWDNIIDVFPSLYHLKEQSL